MSNLINELDIMEIEFLIALRDVLEEMEKSGGEYSESEIEKFAPKYSQAIVKMLCDENVITPCIGGCLIIKPNGNLLLLLERTKGVISEKIQAKKDHVFNRCKAYLTIGCSIIALIISIISIIVSCNH